eukprot:CAMPEP_0172664018 /NCGR_PEP_ID=MMETSP1074-20121228/6308_1 /TAXON_ID=2916 /ORGANISM="Ceratium fusus, Strain PA161109" /LENGTH=320 /DNA_ID=CAMNT_0013480097 /DNA_START=27 /DNA_END=989 /DNA_ORIENTATION=+
MAASDAVPALLELIVQSGGRLAGSQCVQAIQKKDPALRKHIEDAGGLKRFCKQHDVLEFVTVAGSDGFVRASLSVVTELLLSLVDENGGQAELEFVTEAGSDGFVRRAKPALAKASNIALVAQPLPVSAADSAETVSLLRELLAQTPSTSASSGVSSSSVASASECSSDDEAIQSHPCRITNASPVGKMAVNTMHCNLGNTRTMYHATALSSALSIMQSGHFLPGRGGYLGPGIYFCRDRASALRRSHPKSEGPRVVLGFEVQMGLMQTSARKMTTWTEEVQLEPGFHSMKARGKGDDCYMIPDNNLAQIDMTTLRMHEL